MTAAVDDVVAQVRVLRSRGVSLRRVAQLLGLHPSKVNRICVSNKIAVPVAFRQNPDVMSVDQRSRLCLRALAVHAAYTGVVDSQGVVTLTPWP